MPQAKVIDVLDEDIPDTNEAPRPRQAAVPGGNTAGFSDLAEQLRKANADKEAARKQADDEKRARETSDANARRERAAADQARSDAQAARSERNEDRRTAIANAANAKKITLDALEGEYASAMEAGDFKRVAQLQRRMSEEAAELKTLEVGVTALDSERAAERKTTEGRAERQPERQAAADPFDDYVKQFTPTVQEWLRRHPECVTNRTKNSQVIAAHNEAIDKGYVAESDAYFAYIERKMGYKEDAARRAVALDNPTGDDDEGDEPAARGGQRREIQRREEPMRNAAAPSRGGGSSQSARVSLSAGEVEAATDGSIVWNVGQTDQRGVRITADDPRVGMPIGEYEMARRKRAMKAEGRYAVPSLQD